MGRVETVDASELVNPGRRQELQKVTKNAQLPVKWMGGSTDIAEVEVIGANPTGLPVQKAGISDDDHPPSVTPKGIPSVRSNALETSSRVPSLDTGGNQGEDDAFEHFKKGFIEKLAVKAKERPGYMLANKDFAKSVRPQPKLFGETDKDLVKSVKIDLKLKQTKEDVFQSVKTLPMLFEQTESLKQPSSFPSAPNSNKGILERTVEIIESSTVLLQSSSLEKWKSSSPIPSWMSKPEKLKLGQDKQSWSKDVEETTQEFILNNFFQSPSTRPPSNSVYNTYTADEAVTSKLYPPRRLIRETNVSQHQSRNVGQQCPSQISSREVEDFDSGSMLGGPGAVIRGNMARLSAVAPGGGISSADMKKDLSRSPEMRLSSDEKRNDCSGSSGRRLSSEVRRKVLTNSPTRRLSPEERKDSFRRSTKSLEGVFAAEDPRAKDQGTQSDSGMTRNGALDNKQRSVKREMLTMLNSLRMAAAVDKAHFLRAIEVTGAVQSSGALDNDMKIDSSAIDAAPPQPPSPDGRKNIKKLRDARRDLASEARVNRSWEPSPIPRREVAFGSSTRSREPSPSARKETAPFGSFTRSREPSPSRRDSSASTSASRSASGRRSHSFDSFLEESSNAFRTGGILRNGSGERSPSGAFSTSGSSPQISLQSSFRSDETDENGSASGGSMIEKLMRKAILRSSSRLADNQTITSGVPASPKHRLLQPSSSDSKPVLRRTLSFADSNADTEPSEAASKNSSRASSPTSGKNSIESNSPEILQRSLNEKRRSTTRVVTSLSEQSAASAPIQQHPLSNSLRVNVQAKESTIAKLKSRSSTSPRVKIVEESCCPISTPERTATTVTPIGSPSSPGSDDSGSEGSGSSGVEQPSPVSVLSFQSRRCQFQAESRLSPLEQKLQVLHERIRKSNTDVSNLKKARLEKLKETEAQLNGCVVTELDTEALFGALELTTRTVRKTSKEVNTPQVPEAPKPLYLPAPPYVEEKKAEEPKAVLPLHSPSDPVASNQFASPIAVLKDEKVRPATAPLLDFCDSLETLDLKTCLPWLEKNKWDLVYIRDVLLASNFGRDKSYMTKWYSIMEPIDPCLFEKLEEFYRFGKKFSCSQVLSKLAESRERYPNMQAYVQRTFFDPAARERGEVETMNRCFIFDVVNDTLAKKLKPYVGLSRPWMKPLAKPVVRPRPTGSTLMQEIWTDICEQMGDNGSMSMDKAQLHQSLEDLISKDLIKRTELFPTRDIARASERVANELERRILDDLLDETITCLCGKVRRTA